jgi:hypothetical protein
MHSSKCKAGKFFHYLNLLTTFSHTVTMQALYDGIQKASYYCAGVLVVNRLG